MNQQLETLLQIANMNLNPNGSSLPAQSAVELATVAYNLGKLHGLQVGKQVLDQKEASDAQAKAAEPIAEEDKGS